MSERVAIVAIVLLLSACKTDRNQKWECVIEDGRVIVLENISSPAFSSGVDADGWVYTEKRIRTCRKARGEHMKGSDDERI